MSKLFFPSCKIKSAFPKEDVALAAYLEKRWGINCSGCCRENRVKITSDDTAVVVCHTCASIIEESSAADKVIYAWELIDQDESFTFPDYHRERITIQDCYMSRERTSVQKAVRSLLNKMNFEIVELEANFEKTDFCGLRTNEPLKANQELAPKHFCQEGAFTPLPEAERKAYLKQYVSQYTTKRVVTYCGACRGAMKLGGAEVVHLLELLFPSEND